MGQTADDYLMSANLFGVGAGWERARLKGSEALWDPGSEVLLSDLGLTAGWRCLEIGAGGGSLAQWMAGRGAAVTAVDIDTRFIDHLASDTVDIRGLDMRTDPLPPGEFDLVHARIVFEHLSDRQEMLGRLAATLSPVGWIVIEAFDWTYFRWEPEDPALNAITKAILDYVLREGGVDMNYGQHVLTALNQAGLADVHGQGRTSIIDRSHPGFDFFRFTIESMLQTLVECGAVSEADAKAVDIRLHDKHLHVYTPMMMAGIGRRSPNSGSSPARPSKATGA